MSQALITLLSVIQITTPRELLTAMRARYDGKWYRTLTFLQNNTEHHPDGTIEHSTWREWLQAPGKLRIEFQPADSGNGVLFANDSIFPFRHDSLLSSRVFVHPLLVLGFDVYMQPVERTIAQLRQAPRVFDLSVLSEGSWQGYAPVGGGWVSAEVEFLVDGQQQFLEQYEQIQTNVALPATLWDPRQWKAARAAR